MVAVHLGQAALDAGCGVRAPARGIGQHSLAGNPAVKSGDSGVHFDEDTDHSIFNATHLQLHLAVWLPAGNP